MFTIRFPYRIEKTNSVYEIVAEIAEGAVMELVSRAAAIAVGTKLREIAPFVLPENPIGFSITMDDGRIKCEPTSMIRLKEPRESKKSLPKVSIVPSE